MRTSVHVFQAFALGSRPASAAGIFVSFFVLSPDVGTCGSGRKICAVAATTAATIDSIVGAAAVAPSGVAVGTGPGCGAFGVGTGIGAGTGVGPGAGPVPVPVRAVPAVPAAAACAAAVGSTAAAC